MQQKAHMKYSYLYVTLPSDEFNCTMVASAVKGPAFGCPSSSSIVTHALYDCAQFLK
jgi:hypothetical protein